MVILIADDEIHIRRVLELKFRSLAEKLIVATNGREAYDAAVDAKPDLIISDYQMPGEMDGIDMIRALRKHPDLTDTPVVLLTGSVAVLSRIRHLIEDCGNVTLVAKPFSPRGLSKIVEELLEARRTGVPSNLDR